MFSRLDGQAILTTNYNPLYNIEGIYNAGDILAGPNADLMMSDGMTKQPLTTIVVNADYRFSISL